MRRGAEGAAETGRAGRGALKTVRAGFDGVARPERPRRWTLPITALRVTPPSCLAIWLAESPSCQSFLRSSTRSSVQPICASHLGEPAAQPLAPLAGSTSCGVQLSRCSPTTISSKQLVKGHNRRPTFRPQELDVAPATAGLRRAAPLWRHGAASPEGGEFAALL